MGVMVHTYNPSMQEPEAGEKVRKRGREGREGMLGKFKFFNILAVAYNLVFV